MKIYDYSESLNKLEESLSCITLGYLTLAYAKKTH